MDDYIKPKYNSQKVYLNNRLNTDIEYKNNVAKCEHYITIIFPKIKNLIKRINISRCREDIQKLYDLGELYNFNNTFL